MSALAARWRQVGLECAFDPDATAPSLASALAAIDAALLVRHFPREPSGKLPLGSSVLLAPADDTSGPRRSWLVAVSPEKRSASQVITLVIRPEIVRNAEHCWDAARYLWDARAAGVTEQERWGATRETAANAMALVHAGRWREAIAAYGVTHALDELPYSEAYRDRDRPVWEAGLDAQMRTLAPWRLEAALAALRPRSKTGLRLFHLPGQSTMKRWGVTLRRVAGVPHLGVELSGSNERLPTTAWQCPPDLALALRGDVQAPLAVAAKPDGRVDDLLAQIAANPDDDELRRVYGDLVAERGDPRGELIAIQLAPFTSTTQSRVLSLIRKHARTFLGPLGALVDLKEIRFVRGFLDRVSLGGPATPFDAWAGALAPRARLELAHVTHLGLAGGFPIGPATELLAEPPPRLQRLILGAPVLVPCIADPVPELHVVVTNPELLDEAWSILRRAPTVTLRVITERRFLDRIAGALAGLVGDRVGSIERVFVICVDHTDERAIFMLPRA